MVAFVLRLLFYVAPRRSTGAATIVSTVQLVIVRGLSLKLAESIVVILSLLTDVDHVGRLIFYIAFESIVNHGWFVEAINCWAFDTQGTVLTGGKNHIFVYASHVLWGLVEVYRLFFVFVIGVFASVASGDGALDHHAAGDFLGLVSSASLEEFC